MATCTCIVSNDFVWSCKDNVPSAFSYKTDCGIAKEPMGNDSKGVINPVIKNRRNVADTPRCDMMLYDWMRNLDYYLNSKSVSGIDRQEADLKLDKCGYPDMRGW